MDSGEIGGNFSSDSLARRLTGLTGCVTGADADADADVVAPGNTEYCSIWPIGAAVAVIDIFSESGEPSTALAFGFSTPQFTGFRLISAVPPSFAVAGAKKLFSVCLFEALLPSACRRRLGGSEPADGLSRAER